MSSDTNIPKPATPAKFKHDTVPYHPGVILLASAASGALFGFGLQKSQVYLPRTIIGQMLLTDWTMMKMFLTAVATSSFVHALLVSVDPQMSSVVEMLRNRHTEKGLGVTAIGGVLLGAGMAFTGSCPGTFAPQIGAGLSSGAIVLVSGLGGALLYVLADALHVVRPLYPIAKLKVEQTDRLLGISYPAAASGLGVMLLGAVAVIERFFPTAVPIWPISIYSRIWSPVLGGVAIGLSQLPMLLLAHRAIGASSAYVTAIANLLYPFVPDAVRSNKHLIDAKDGIWNYWQPVFLAGAVAGGYISARLGGVWYGTGSWKDVSVSPALTAVGTCSSSSALILCRSLTPGGVLLLFGARLANGCTSGHGISGMSQLNLRSVTMVAAMLAGGIGCALALRAVGAYGSLAL